MSNEYLVTSTSYDATAGIVTATICISDGNTLRPGDSIIIQPATPGGPQDTTDDRADWEAAKQVFTEGVQAVIHQLEVLNISVDDAVRMY